MSHELIDLAAYPSMPSPFSSSDPGEERLKELKEVRKNGF